MNKHDHWESIPSGEERLLNFAVLIIEPVETMPDTKAENHLAGQLMHSGTSPALAMHHWRMKIINR